MKSAPSIAALRLAKSCLLPFSAVLLFLMIPNLSAQTIFNAREITLLDRLPIPW